LSYGRIRFSLSFFKDSYYTIFSPFNQVEQKQLDADGATQDEGTAPATNK